MSVEHKAVFCYGIYYDHKKTPEYIETVGENRFNEILEEYRIPGVTYKNSDFEILGIKLNTVDSGYALPLGQTYDIIEHRNKNFLSYRDAMAELQEFSSPQFWLICQID